MCFKDREIEALQILDRSNSDLFESRLRHLADSGDPAYWEWEMERIQVPGLDDEKAVGALTLGLNCGHSRPYAEISKKLPFTNKAAGSYVQGIDFTFLRIGQGHAQTKLVPRIRVGISTIKSIQCK